MRLLKLFFTIMGFILPSLASAFELDTALKIDGTNSLPEEVKTPGGIISLIVPNVLILSGVILLFYLVFGGFTIISGGGKPEEVEKGQKAITGAIIGFVVIFAAYWIVQIIEILTGVKILNSTILS